MESLEKLFVEGPFSVESFEALTDAEKTQLIEILQEVRFIYRNERAGDSSLALGKIEKAA